MKSVWPARLLFYYWAAGGGINVNEGMDDGATHRKKVARTKREGRMRDDGFFKKHFLQSQ